MTALSEREIIDRHKQSLGEAHRACQMLGKNADPEYIAMRGIHYVALKEALEHLEGSARQMAHYRADARWVRLGILYAKLLRVAQVKFIGQKWQAFTDLMPLFENGMRHINDLEAKTGARGPILPARPSDWLVLPDWKSPFAQATSH